MLGTISGAKAFEDRVVKLYELMGYEVKRNLRLLDHPIDALLTYTMPGGVKTRFAIECKYTEKGNLTKKMAINSINTLTDLKRNDLVESLVIVTPGGFSDDLRSVARAKKIQLLTFKELQHQILKVDQYLEYLIRDFEKELGQYYVDIVAQDEEINPRNIYDPLDKRALEGWTKIPAKGKKGLG